jgi:hypothetical protein
MTDAGWVTEAAQAVQSALVGRDQYAR